MRKLSPWTMGSLIAVAAVGAALIVLPMATTGCKTASMLQANAIAATNAYPKTVATIDGLRVIADTSGSNTLATVVDIGAALAIGGLGVWAKLMHGQVANNSAAIAANVANNNLTATPKV
jgi:hypothetical protein